MFIAMIYTVQKFCDIVERDLNGFIEQIEYETSRNVSAEEKRAWASSYKCVSRMFASAIKKKPSFADVQVSSTDVLLEYKLPAASAWCDLVLLGSLCNKKKVVVLELKDWLKNNDDKPGAYEGLVEHRGNQVLHPAEQVKGYVEYCRRFHSAVLDAGADVNGCVYFTQPITLDPYRVGPNSDLTRDYPLFNVDDIDQLSNYVINQIERGDELFAIEFENGFYKQNRNVLNQVAASFNVNADNRPFVLLEEQRRGLNLSMATLDKVVESKNKQVIIVYGPPGSGKSAVAVNLWFEAALKYSQNVNCGNIVYVSTSSSQGDNWSTIFNQYGALSNASGFICKANSFNPGLNGTLVKSKYAPIFAEIDSKYVKAYDKGGTPISLKYEFYEDYVNYMIEHGETKNYKDNLHFLSIVDEAHALINPAADNFSTNKTSGWCMQAGPQAYHIIKESLVSVFFMDGEQSFRDNETTSIADIEKLAEHLGASCTKISLEGMQFRCAGSKDYVDWVESLFSTQGLHNFEKWRNNFRMKVVDSPFEMEKNLIEIIESGNKSVRILSSYTREWKSREGLDRNHSKKECTFDFDFVDKYGNRYQKYWNNPESYDIFVQGSKNSLMEKDPLCEVGCPYVVRGFDYDYVGILWLKDLVRRGDKWMINFSEACETATNSSRKMAFEEQVALLKSKGLSVKKAKERLENFPVVANDRNTPYTTAFFRTIVQAYRILFTRAVKGIYVYIQDDETRTYVQELLKYPIRIMN